MTNSTWTPQQDDELRHLWGLGLSSIQIGVQMGVSKDAVIGRKSRLKLAPRASPIGASGARPKPAVPIIKSASTQGATGAVIPARLKPAIPYVPPVVSPVRDCQWIENDGRPWLFCEEPVRNMGCSYCADHAERVFVTPHYGEHGIYLAAAVSMKMTVPEPVSEEVADQSGVS